MTGGLVRVLGLAGLVAVVAIGGILMTGGAKSEQQAASSDISQAASTAALANTSIAIPAAEAYRSTHGSYLGLTTQALQASGGAALPAGLQVGWATATSYCIEDTIDGGTSSYVGPVGTRASTPCPPAP